MYSDPKAIIFLTHLHFRTKISVKNKNINVFCLTTDILYEGFYIVSVKKMHRVFKSLDFLEFAV